MTRSAPAAELGRPPDNQPGTGALQISHSRMQQRWPTDAHSLAVGHSLTRIYVVKALGLVSFAEPNPTFASHDSHVVTKGEFGAICALGRLGAMCRLMLLMPHDERN